MLDAVQPIVFAPIIFLLLPMLILRHFRNSKWAVTLFARLKLTDDLILQFIFTAVVTRISLQFLHHFISGEILSLLAAGISFFLLIAAPRKITRIFTLRKLALNSLIFGAGIVTIFLILIRWISAYYVVEGSNHDLQYFYEGTIWFTKYSLLELSNNDFFVSQSAISQFVGPATRFNRGGLFNELSLLWPLHLVEQPIIVYLGIAVGLCFYFLAFLLFVSPKNFMRDQLIGPSLLLGAKQTILIIITPPALLIFLNANLGSFIAGSLLCLIVSLLINRPVEKTGILISLILALTLHIYPEVVLIQTAFILAYFAFMRFDFKKLVTLKSIPIKFGLVFLMASNFALITGFRSWVSAITAVIDSNYPSFFLDKPYLWLLAPFATLSSHNTETLQIFQLVLGLLLFVYLMKLSWKNLQIRSILFIIPLISVTMFCLAFARNQHYFENKIIGYLGIVVWLIAVSFCFKSRLHYKVNRNLFVVISLSLMLSFVSLSVFLKDVRFFTQHKSIQQSASPKELVSSIKVSSLILDDSGFNPVYDFQKINYLLTELTASKQRVLMPDLGLNSLRGSYFNYQLSDSLNLQEESGYILSKLTSAGEVKFIDNSIDHIRDLGDYTLSSFSKDSHFVLFGSGFDGCDSKTCKLDESFNLYIFRGKDSVFSKVRISAENGFRSAFCFNATKSNSGLSCDLVEEDLLVQIIPGWNRVSINSAVKSSGIGFKGYMIESISFETSNTGRG